MEKNNVTDINLIFALLSDGEKSAFSKNIFFETTLEMWTLILSLLFLVIFLLANPLGYPYFALFSAAFSILMMIAHTISSVVRQLDFMSTPIRTYVKSLGRALEVEDKMMDQLRAFHLDSVIAARDILEQEHTRVRRNLEFIAGATEKVGILPALFAFIYAFEKFYSTTTIGFLPYIILCMMLSFSFGVMLLRRILVWQSECSVLLSNYIKRDFNAAEHNQ